MQAALDPWVPIPMPVLSTTRETADTVTLVLDASAHPMSFAPGQFTMLYAFGHGEVPISISGDPGEPHRLVHTIRSVGKVTEPLVGTHVGEVLGVRGPFGTAWPVEQARGGDLVIVAGGIGIAPVRPVIYQVIRERERYGRVLVLLGARTPDGLLFSDELWSLAKQHDLLFRATVDRPAPGWRGSVGVVTRLLEVAAFDPTTTTLMTCGPEVMMRFVIREAVHQGIDPTRIWLSMERNMKCAIGLCGHCQWGRDFLCRTGPVMRWDAAAERFAIGGLG